MSTRGLAREERKPRCSVCGSVELAADADLRSPTCEDCKAARDHVVSMQTLPSGGSMAVCPCGWSSTVVGRGRHMILDTKVRMHWRAMIGLAAEAAQAAGGASC